jgi:hypothetical protein
MAGAMGMLKRKAQIRSNSQLKRSAPMKPGGPIKTRKPMKSGGPIKTTAQIKRTAMKKSPPVKLTKMQMSAKGKDCMVRVPRVCNFNPETTVLGHLNGGGMGAKHSDIFAAYVCSACHAWLDGGYAASSTRDERDLLHLQGVIRTQPFFIDLGLIFLTEAA